MVYPLSSVWGTAISAVYALSIAGEWLAVRRVAERGSPGRHSTRGVGAILREAADVLYLPAGTSDARRTDRNTRALLVLGSLGGLGTALLIPLLRPESVNTAALTRLQPIALVVVIAGAWLRRRSVTELGPAAIRVVHASENVPLVTSGPFRFIRNPAYAGSLLMYAGIGIALASWMSTVCAAVVPLVSRLPRMRREEEVLLEVHGAPYRAYKSRVKRLIPWVW
ncbi:isoprenylcysteine carboxylmethyltransferase family protein [Streptomyces sp. NPDC047022]|uniref:methyltransferase family protein n=1 Tax=Streptomyces sp. NPDC047022 TaxID=3155737 RepID=UPI0033D35742